MMANRNTIPCPHCKGSMRTITSRQLSDLRTLVPSLVPSAGVSLPIVERRPHNDIIVPSAKNGAGGQLPPTASTPPSSEAGSTRYVPMALN